jgi:ABC-type multidrug transport system ATPase subunit
MVGDGGLMMRGISGGERKRLTTAEMVVGPQRVLLMDEISTGLDSATLFSVISFFTSVRCGGTASTALPTTGIHLWSRLRQHKILFMCDQAAAAAAAPMVDSPCKTADYHRCGVVVLQMSHALNLTTIVSLLQPPPEVFNMFDDLLLLANGKMLYHGPLQVRLHAVMRSSVC